MNKTSSLILCTNKEQKCLPNIGSSGVTTIFSASSFTETQKEI